ncbi:MAG: glycosyltransferase, partial [bacterium]
IVRGLMAALERKGFEVRIFEVDASSYQPPWYCFMDICSFEPDLIIQANIPSSVLFPRELARTLAVPRVVWYVDNPVYFWQPHPNFFFTEHDHVFVSDTISVDFARSCGAQNVGVLYLSGSTDLQVSDQPREDLRCPLSFVGQIVNVSDIWNMLTEEENRALTCLIDLRLQDPWADMQGLLAGLTAEQTSLVSRIPQRLKTPLHSLLYITSNARQRIQVLESVAQYGLKLYGTDAWLTVPAEDSPLRKCYCGPVEYRTEFPLVCKSSDINLNINSLQDVHSPNMRIYDVPLLDGFLLSDWFPGADNFLVPDREMVFWRTIDELRRKIEYYLDHPDERQEVIQRGKQRILRDHTYDARADQLLRELGIAVL